MILFETTRESSRSLVGAKSFTGGEDKWQGANERQKKNDLDSVVRLDCFVIQWIPQFSQRRDVSPGIAAIPIAERGSYRMLIDIPI